MLPRTIQAWNQRFFLPKNLRWNQHGNPHLRRPVGRLYRTLLGYLVWVPQRIEVTNLNNQWISITKSMRCIRVLILLMTSISPLAHKTEFEYQRSYNTSSLPGSDHPFIFHFLFKLFIKKIFLISPDPLSRGGVVFTWVSYDRWYTSFWFSLSEVSRHEMHQKQIFWFWCTPS